MADAITLLNTLDVKVRRAYWLMGDSVVREALIESIAARVGAAPEDRASCSALKMADVVDQINAYGMDATHPRLVVIRDAELLRDAESVREWLDSRHIPNVHAIFVSGWERWEPRRWRKTDDPHRPELRELFAGTRTTTMLVDCSFAETDIGRTKMVDLVQDWGPGITREQAIHVLTTTAWSLAEARDAARKVAYCCRVHPEGRLSNAAVGRLVTRRPSSEYVDSVLALNRPAALEAAPLVEPEAVAGIISTLDWNLDVLGKLNRMQRAEESDYALQQRMNIHRVVIEKLRPLAKHYDPRTVLRRSELIVSIDRAASTYGGGRQYPDGVLQVIAARW